MPARCCAWFLFVGSPADASWWEAVSWAHYTQNKVVATLIRCAYEQPRDVVVVAPGVGEHRTVTVVGLRADGRRVDPRGWCHPAGTAPLQGRTNRETDSPHHDGP